MKVCVIILVSCCMGAGLLNASELANMSKLLAVGENFSDKVVSFTGYVCSTQDSSDGVFLTFEDCERSNYDNAIKLVSFEKKKECDGLVTITGAFRYQKGTVWLDDPYQWGRVEVTNLQCLSRNSRHSGSDATDRRPETQRF